LSEGGFQDHFSLLAHAYARHRPTYPDALFDFLRSRCPGSTLAWDCAAGSGQATRALAGRFQQVVASDLSARQLAQAPRHPGVCYVLAPAEAAPVVSGAADLVVVAQALHWFPHRAFFDEARRVLRPGGIFAAWCYTLLTVDRKIDRIVKRFYDEDLGSYWPLRRSLVEDAYRSIQVPFRPLDAPAFTMEMDWTLEQLLGYLGTWSAVRRYREAVGADPLDRIREALAGAWGTSGERRRVRWPLHLKAGIRE
jgi:ubiquinone/menaquinone biosynthesis C-methylase UbiE